MNNKVMDCNVVNQKISYEFDDKLKAVLDSVPVEADELLGKTPNSTPALIRGGQMLREHLRKNQNKINRTEHRNLLNPDYLAFAIMYCSEYHKYKNLTELNEDLAHPFARGFIKPLFKIDCGGNSEVTTTCACGKGITDVYYYQNPDTKLGFFIGNFCINTGFILNEQEKKDMNDAFMIKCETCGHKTYKTNSLGKKKEKGCSRCVKTKRRCETCKLYKVKKDAESWKVNCLDCYFLKNPQTQKTTWRNPKPNRFHKKLI
jgi:hypothetical protein